MENGTQKDWKEVAKRVKNKLVKNQTVLGIILFGRFARGNPTANDTINFLIIMNKNYHREQSFEFEGYKFYLKYVFKDYCNEKINQKNFFYIRTLAEGKIVYDSRKITAYLKKLAIEKYLEGPDKPTEKQISEIKSELWRTYQEIKELVLKYPAQALVVMGQKFPFILKSYFYTRGYWFSDTRFLLSNLKKKDPSLYDNVKKYLNSSSADEKFIYLKQILDKVLKPFGGLTYADSPPKEEISFKRRFYNMVLHPFRVLKSLYHQIKTGEPDEEESFFSDLVRFLHLLLPYKSFFVNSAIMSIFVTFLLLPIARMTKLLVDSVIYQGNKYLLNYLLIGILIISIIRAVIFFVMQYYEGYFSNLMDYDIRFKFYSHLLRLSYSFYDIEEKGQIIYRFQDASSALRLATRIVLKFLNYIIIALLIPLFLFLIDWRLTVLSAIVIPFYIINYYQFSKIIGRYVESITRRKAEYTAKNYESISGIRIIQSLCLEGFWLRRMKRIYLEIRKFALRIYVAMAGLNSINTIIGAIGSFLVMWYIWHTILDGRLSLGTVSGYLVLISYLFKPVIGIISMGPDIQRAIIRSRRFFKMYDVESEVKEKDDAIEREIRGEIEFRNVFFEYEIGKETLKNINIKIRAGEIVALVGASGSGKTTFTNLIPRFYDITDGEILIDGVNIKEFKLQSLRQQIGIVPQDDFLFVGSIKDNIRIFNYSITDKEIEQAAKIANIHNFIMNLPDRYDTIIGEQGVKLSAGERKRICIARALAINPKILIFDEATAPVDMESEKLIHQALKEVFKDRTVIIIAHRAQTIKYADRIAVFNNGHIIDVGTHNELIQRCREYRNVME